MKRGWRRSRRELDVSNATLEAMLKKYEGVSEDMKKGETRAAIADAMKGKYPLHRIRKRLGRLKSTYYYHKEKTGESPKKKKEALLPK